MIFEDSCVFKQNSAKDSQILCKANVGYSFPVKSKIGPILVFITKEPSSFNSQALNASPSIFWTYLCLTLTLPSSKSTSKIPSSSSTISFFLVWPTWLISEGFLTFPVATGVIAPTIFRVVSLTSFSQIISSLVLISFPQWELNKK